MSIAKKSCKTANDKNIKIVLSKEMVKAKEDKKIANLLVNKKINKNLKQKKIFNQIVPRKKVLAEKKVALKEQKDEHENTNFDFSKKAFVIKNDINISYPKKAKRFRIQGEVIVKVFVSKKGHVKNFHILSGPSFGLKDHAAQIIKSLQFSPATDKDGKNISSIVLHKVIYRLNKAVAIKEIS